MASPEHSAGERAGEGCAGPGVPESAARHARSFKLRFAAQRVPGQSDVSAVRPLTLPAPVTDKWWRPRARGDGEAEARALRRVQAQFARGPRDKYSQPALSSHEYGWWAHAAVPGDRRLQYPLRTSEWLKSRLRVLAEEARLGFRAATGDARSG